MNNKKNNRRKKDTVNKKLIIQVMISIVLVIAIIFTKQFDNNIANKIVNITEEKISENIDISPATDFISRLINKSSDRLSMMLHKETEFAAPVNGTIQKRYGITDTDTNPYYNHGIDIISNTETVRSIAEGKVIIVSNNLKLSNYIVVEEDNKRIIYGKINQIFIEKGDDLKKGDIIGTLDIENPILHIEVWEDGESINPEKIFNIDE